MNSAEMLFRFAVDNRSKPGCPPGLLLQPLGGDGLLDVLIFCENANLN
jgi:hypothetical protein